MATQRRDILDSEDLNYKEYFINNDNLCSVQKELSFSVLRRYNCFAGCHICYIDKYFEKDKQSFSNFIPQHIPSEIEKEWDKIFNHYHYISTIDDLYWMKHKAPHLYEWYRTNASKIHFGTLTDNSFVRSYNIFTNEIDIVKQFPEITFSDMFLMKVNIDELMDKLNVINKRYGIKLAKLVKAKQDSLDHKSVKRFVEWAKVNCEEFSIHHDFLQYDTIDIKNKDQETVFASFNSDLYNVCGEIDYLQYDSFFLTLEEASNVKSTPYYTIENGFDNKMHLAKHLQAKIELYSRYSDRLKTSSGKTRNYYNYFTWVSQNLIVNDDYTYIPMLSLKNFHNYYKELVKDGWLSTPVGLLSPNSKQVIPIFGFK